MEGLYRSVLRGQYKKLPPVYSKDLHCSSKSELLYVTTYCGGLLGPHRKLASSQSARSALCRGQKSSIAWSCARCACAWSTAGVAQHANHETAGCRTRLGCSCTRGVVASQAIITATHAGRLADLSPFLPEPQYDVQVTAACSMCGGTGP
eukprot:1872071-Amphidinium_carterae.1